MLPHATIKRVIQNFTGGLAQLLTQKGIRFNCVAPVPMKRPGQPRGVAPICGMLA